MDSRDEAGVNGDETLDWLWDLDDRYDVGSLEEDPSGGARAVSAAAGGSGVKKHLRKQRVPVGAAPAATGLAGGDAPGVTAAIAPVFAAGAGRRLSLRDRLIRDGRITSGGMAAAVALLLAFGAIAFSVLNGGGGSTNPSNRVAISPTTDTTTPPDTTTQPPTTDTTTTAAPPTNPVAAVTPTGTTLSTSPNVPTTRSCNRTARLLSLMVDSTTTPSVTTTTAAPATTTTVRPTTTTVATTVPVTQTSVPRTTPHVTSPPPTNPPPTFRGC